MTTGLLQIIVGVTLVLLVVGVVIYLFHLQKTVGKLEERTGPLQYHVNEADKEAQQHASGPGRDKFRSWLHRR